MSPRDVDILEQRVRDRFVHAMEGQGLAEVVNIQQDISVPVQYVDGGVIRSAPGEPPRMETGALYLGIDHHVEDDRAEDVIRLTISSDRITDGPEGVPGLLEYGGYNIYGKMVEPRPYMVRMLEQDRIGGRLPQALKGVSIR